MNIYGWIVAACWATFLIVWIVTSFGAKRDIGGVPWRRSWWFRIALALFIVGGVLERLRFGNASFHLGLSTAGPLPAIGSILCVAGVALAIWARVHLGRNWSPAPALKEGHELVTSGPYRLVRHPIYTGIITALIGASLVFISALIALVVVGAMFVWRVRAEEKLMMQQFPDAYPDYKRRSWALIPYVW
jgi:protein-S-isoprenylcysteine O-methyltransferase Ste14